MGCILKMNVSASTRNSQLSALTALLDGGFLKIYTGFVPGTPETGASGTLLSTLTFGTPAFGAPSGGAATANAITGDTDAAATGTATWFRCLQSDGTTAVLDGTIGIELALSLNTIHTHDHVSISSLVIRL